MPGADGPGPGEEQVGRVSEPPQPAGRFWHRLPNRLSGGHPRLMWGALGATLVMLVVGWRLKAPCLDPATWPDNGVWKARCYSDVYALYGVRDLHTKWPYLESFNEYPPIAAFWQAILGRASDDVQTFTLLNTIGLGLLALATTVLLVRSARQHVWLWSLAPPVALYYAYNWDMLAVLPLVAGLVMWQKQRFAWAGALVAVAACAKWYPGILLPVLGMELIRREGRLGPQGWRFGLAATGTLAAINVPLALANWDGFKAPYVFHGQRSATTESHWNVVGHYMQRWDVAGWESVRSAAEHGLVYVIILSAILAVLVWRGRLEVIGACALGVVGWLIVSPVLSMQYALWVAPMLVMVRARVPWVVAFYVADMLVFFAVWRYFANAGEDHLKAFEPLGVASMLRLAALACLVVVIAKAAWRARPDGPLDAVQGCASAYPGRRRIQ